MVGIEAVKGWAVTRGIFIIFDWVIIHSTHLHHLPGTNKRLDCDHDALLYGPSLYNSWEVNSLGEALQIIPITETTIP